MLFLKAGIGFLIGAVVLYETDRGIWYQTCLLKSIGTQLDPDEVYKSTDNSFFVPKKLIPAACAISGLFITLITEAKYTWIVVTSIAAFSCFILASIISALRAFARNTPSV